MLPYFSLLIGDAYPEHNVITLSTLNFAWLCNYSYQARDDVTGVY
jgi:hypothetical protein